MFTTMFGRVMDNVHFFDSSFASVTSTNGTDMRWGVR